MRGLVDKGLEGWRGRISAGWYVVRRREAGRWRGRFSGFEK
jgi:hypothetical protein